MTRFKLTVEYDGGPFVGWQRQDNGPSVQQALEEAIAAFAHEKATLFGAGRTDAGVHASGQVAHFDLAKEFGAAKVRDAINYHLKPLPVAVIAAEAVGEDFHARFSAKSRAYRYRIINRRPPLTLERGRAWRVSAPLDHGAMAAAAGMLVGEHDFTTFRGIACQADSPVKTLDELSVTRTGEEVVIAVRSRSFLLNQVRIIAGTLKLVGEGKWRPSDVKAALDARDRAEGGPTAPPEGLYLVEVRY